MGEVQTYLTDGNRPAPPQGLYRAIDANAGAFASEFLNDEFELDMLDTEPERWAGMMGCEVAVAVITGGAGSVRVAKLLSRDGFLDDLRDFERRHGNDTNDTDNDAPGPAGPRRSPPAPWCSPPTAAAGPSRPSAPVTPCRPSTPPPAPGSPGR